jgi:hypothetical protein
LRPAALHLHHPPRRWAPPLVRTVAQGLAVYLHSRAMSLPGRRTVCAAQDMRFIVGPESPPQMTSSGLCHAGAAAG